jgi:uncharacterized phage protein gp47/JayE
MAGVDSTGFTIKTLQEVLADLDASLRTELGENLRLDADSVLGQIRGAIGTEISLVWEALGEVAAALDPDQAVGVYLDALAALSGITPRQQATRSTGTITVNGTSGTVIPAGSRVRDAASTVTVETTASATIAGATSVPVQALTTGPIEAAAASLTVIVTPVAGWSSSTNAAALTPGQNIESDLQLRARREASLQASGTGTDGGIRAALLEIVEQAVVLSNRTNSTAADGTPAHAVRAILYPDPNSATVEAAIATAYFGQLPAGIQAWGTSVTATVTDSQGVDHTIEWDYATEVDVYIDVTVTLAPGSDVVAADIQAAIVAYVNALEVGDDVRVLRVYQAIQAVSDEVLSASSLAIDIVDPPVATSDLAIDIDEIARTATANIGVTIA